MRQSGGKCCNTGIGRTDGVVDRFANHGGVETEKKKSVITTENQATPSNANPETTQKKVTEDTDDTDDEFEEDVDLIDDREVKPKLATSSDADEEDEDAGEDAELASPSDADEEETEIDLTFDANGGEFASGTTTVTNQVTLPNEISIPSVNHRTGYELTGWYTEPEGGDLIASGASSAAYVDEERLNGATTLYAHWEAISYTITFMDGYTTLKTVKVKYGESLEIPEELKEYDDSLSYYITGWSTKNTQDSDLYDFSQPVTYNFALYAKKAERLSLSNSTYTNIYLTHASYPYTGKPIENVIEQVRYTVMETSGWNTTTLVEGEDYTVSYENNTDIGTGTVTIRGIHKYQGTQSATFSIMQASLDSAEIIFNDNSNGIYTFTGKSICPDITVKVGDAVLTEGVDYRVESDWPKNVGTTYVRLAGIGGYTGYVSVPIQIVATEITEECKANLNYNWNVYLHVGDSIPLITAEPESALAAVSYFENWSGTDSSLFSLADDGTLTALKEGQTQINPVVYWKDGNSTLMAGVNLYIVPESQKIVTVKTILPEGSYYDGTTECVYTSTTDQDIYFKSLSSMDDKVFQGWYSEEGTKVINSNSGLRNPDKDMTLYGKYAKKITIHFDYGEGSVKYDSYKTSELAEGETTWLMTGNNSYAYEREGYILVGWCLDPNCEGEVLTGNYTPKLEEGQSEVTLYAKWERSYQISFDTGEGYFLYDSYGEPINVQEGHSVGNALPRDPVSTTATFDGWFTEDGVRVTKSYVPTGDVKLYAHWLNNKTYRVTFHANGEYFRDNEKADETDPTTATRQVQEGYPTSIFVYRQNYNCQWYKDSAFTIPYNMDAAVTEDLDLYARWVRQLRLSWDADGGVDTSGRGSGYTSFDEGSASSIPTVTKEGFRFDGWYTEDGTLITKQTKLSESVSIKARWTPAQVHVTLDLDGGELASYYDQTDLYVNPGDRLATVINGAPRKEGAAFLGWSAEDGTHYDRLYDITAGADQAEMKLKAEWTTDYVTVTYDAEDGSIYDEFSMEYTNKLSYRVAKNQKYPAWMFDPHTDAVGDRTIKGWNKDQGAEAVQDTSEMIFTEDTVLHPVWSAYWTISFDYMGGFYHTNSQNQMSRVIARGQELTYPGANQMVRPGYRFAGWYETVDYSGEKFDPPFVPERNMLLYAKWISETAQVYQVTFCTDPEDESAEKLVREVSDGDRVAKPADPVKSGWIFGGWYKDAACKEAYDFATTVSGDFTLYAKWTETKNVEDADITFAPAVYNGSKQEPKATVKLGSLVLTEGTDYTITYPEVIENTNAGTGYAIIEGLGEFEGSIKVKFEIAKAQYDVTPQITRIDAVYGQKLSDLDLSEAGEGWSFKDGSQSVGTVGEHIVKLLYKAADNNHEDKEAELTVVVAALAMSSENTKVSLAKDEAITYDGFEQKPKLSVVLEGKTLTEGVDYTVSYRDNVNAGTAAYEVSGIGNYNGTLGGTFVISKAAASAADFGIANQVYEGVYDGTLSEVSPALPEHWSWADPDTVFDTVTGDATMNFPANFTTYEGCNFASAENVLLKVRIAPRKLQSTDVKLQETKVYYTGEACKVDVSVTSHGKTLKENQDYTLTYRNNVEIGTASVIVTGKGNYTGTVTETFRIITDPYDIRGAEIRVNPAVSDYTGEEITPEVTVLIENAETGVVTTLSQGTDYTLRYANNVNPGKGTVIITGTGKYHDTKAAKFLIQAETYEIHAIYGDQFSDVAGQLPAGWSWKDADAYVGDVTGSEGRSVEAVYTADEEEQSGSFRLIVTAKPLRSEMIQVNGENISYHPDAEKNKAEVVVTDPELQKVLVENTDYIVEYSNYEQVSTGGAVVTVTGIGNYKGSFSNKYTIAKADPNFAFQSDKVEQKVMKLTVLDEPFFLYTTFAGAGTVTYTSGDDSVFTVETKDNQIGNAKDGYITVTGIGEADLTMKLTGDPNYKDQEIVIRVQVQAVALQDSYVSLSQDSYVYTGEDFCPEITVNYAGKTLTEGTDYEVAYAGNRNAGEAHVTVTGRGSFSGTVVKSFTIEKAENPAEAVEPSFTTVYGEKLETLKLPEGWLWRDANGTAGDVGEHEVEIYLVETANYREKVSHAKVTVETKQSEKEMLQAELSQITFTGNEAKPKITLTDGDYTLKEGVDYEVSYRNNLHAGTAVMILTFKGNYAGTLEQEFTIEQAETEITVKAGLSITGRLQDGSFLLEAAANGVGELQYTSSNPAVATVDEEGVVTPVGAGTTILTVIYLGDADHKPAAVSVELTVTKTTESTSDRDHSASGSSGSGENGTGSAAGQTITYQGISLPSYVNVRNQWQLLENGSWTLLLDSGEAVRDQWIAVYNPYADASRGQQAYDWYRFDNNGNMMTGWYTDEKGDTYYLNPNSDNTKGGMKAGWVEIDGKWYYFNTVSDGTRGKLLKNTITPDGYQVREDGSWDGEQKK